MSIFGFSSVLLVLRARRLRVLGERTVALGQRGRDASRARRQRLLLLLKDIGEFHARVLLRDARLRLALVLRQCLVTGLEDVIERLIVQVTLVRQLTAFHRFVVASVGLHGARGVSTARTKRR